MAELEKKLMPDQASRVRQLHTENVKLSLDIQCLSNLLDIMNDENNRKQLAYQQLQNRNYQAPQPYAYPLSHPYQNQQMVNYHQQNSPSSGIPSPNILPPVHYPQFPLSQTNPLYLHQGSSFHPTQSTSHTPSPPSINYTTQRGSVNVLNKLLPSPSQVWSTPNSPYGSSYQRPDTIQLNRPMPPLPRSQSDQPQTASLQASGAGGSQNSVTIQEEDVGGTWNCAHCTFANYQELRVCEICDKPRCNSPLGNAIHSIGSLYSQSKRIISTATKKHKHHHHGRRGYPQDRSRVSRNNSHEDNPSTSNTNNDNNNPKPGTGSH